MSEKCIILRKILKLRISRDGIEKSPIVTFLTKITSNRLVQKYATSFGGPCIEHLILLSNDMANHFIYKYTKIGVIQRRL